MELADDIQKYKKRIIDHVVVWIEKNYPDRTDRHYKCARDLEYVLDAYSNDLRDGTDVNTKFIGQAYWKGGVRQLKEFKVEVLTHEYVYSIIKERIPTDDDSIKILCKLKDILINLIEHGPEKSIMDIIGKRKHVYVYKKDDIPDSSDIREVLLKAWQITPSKQNIMPYQINVLGPDQRETKLKIYDKVVGNHVYMEEEGLKEGAISHVSNKINPHYRHVLENPYLLVFSQRVCTEKDINPFYQRQIEQGHFMEQASENWVEKIKGSTCIEAALFAQNVAAFCLEKGIDYSFTVCFPGDVKKWANIPFVKHSVVLLMSIGKAEMYRRDFLPQGGSDQDYKTAFENVVKFEL